jgi:nitroimidazol reductase NimA-like FMN-containing flavoprotein (pyridoxamine 5'-phosphate oxidase superfamily)
MRTIDRRSGLDIIDRDECLALLRDDVIGRVGIVTHGAPLVLPVNYAMDGEAVVFRTAAGSKLSAAGRASACFEIDGFDRVARTGWSVVVRGRLEEVTAWQQRDLERVQATGVAPWTPEGRDHWMRIVPTQITGRRIAP